MPSTSAGNEYNLEIPVSIIIASESGRLFGTVTDAASRDPVENARIEAVADYEMFQLTDQDGRYAFDDIPAFDYEFRVIAGGFLPFNFDPVSVHDGDEIELNAALLHSEFFPEPARIETIMQPDDELEIPLVIHNRGNGPLTWSVERVFPEGGMAEPWEHRWHHRTSEVLGNNRLGGVEFADGHFYVAGGVRDSDNLIYVLNRDGEPVDTFPQFTDSNYGMRGFAWDGELLWGQDNGEVFGFTLNGDLRIRFESPLDPSRAITWDSERQLLWICNATTDFYGVDRDGEVQIELERPGEGLHPYGMGYFPEDADGFPLYMFCVDGDANREIWKLDPVSREVMFVVEPQIEGQSGSATVSGMWDPYSWTFIGLTRSNPDAIEVFQLKSRTNWLNVEPAGGVVDAGDQAALTVHMSSEGIPEDVEFNADFRFTHDAAAGETDIPVSLLVTEIGGVSQRRLDLSIGWNLVSVNIAPDPEVFSQIVAPLADNGLLMLAKDGAGRFFIPGMVNQIETWQPLEAYWLKVAGYSQLQVGGEVIAAETPIDLEEGWNAVAYLPRGSLDATVALSGIEESLEVAKDGTGGFYMPTWNFSNLDLMQQGKGYLLKMTGEARLVYNVDGGFAVNSLQSSPDETWISRIKQTDCSYSLLVIAGDELSAGDRLEGLTPSGLAAGRGRVNSAGMAGLALWGDDPSSDEIEGFAAGEAVRIRNVSTQEEITLSLLDGSSGTWQQDGWGVMRTRENPAPLEFRLGAAYPNPFNSQARITFQIPQQAEVDLRVYDLSGREVAVLHSGSIAAGNHSEAWNASAQPSGIYLIRMEAKGFNDSQKIVLVR